MTSFTRSAMSYKDQINKWETEHNTRCNSTITSTHISVILNTYNFKLSIPRSVGDFYIIESVGNTFDWIDDMNIEIIENDFKLYDIISNIYSKVQNLSPKEETKSEHVDSDLIMYKQKKYLESLIESSISPLTSATGETSVKNKLFSVSHVPKIIIDEYMYVWKTLVNNKTITIELHNNNLYTWSIKYHKFANRELNMSLESLDKQHGYDYIELLITFHSSLYPNYPPMLKILRPRLDNGLMHKLSNTKMIRSTYWVPTRDMLFIINKVYKLLNKHATFNASLEINNKTVYPNGSYYSLENQLIQLAALVDSKEEKDDIDDQKYESISIKNESYKSTAKKTDAKYWASGTGYGHSGCSTWDINAYIKAQEERDSKIRIVLYNITVEIQETKGDLIPIYKSIENSILISYIKSTLNGVTLLEISKHLQVYKIIYDLISTLITENSIYLFHDKTNKSLYTYIKEVYSMAETAIKFDKTGDDMVNTIINIYNMLKPLYEKYVESLVVETKETETKTETKIEKSTNQIYIDTMNELKFDTAKLLSSKFSWYSNYTKDKGTKITYQKRMVQEYTTLQNSLPIHYDASIFARADTENLSVIQALITGPKDTPYENGCFIFDIYIPTTYPANPPLVWHITHGGKRFNPNLYAEGKVCLSLIGTWSGDKGAESWNAKTSTLYQVLVSIQSQILTETPVFNEPGYETYFNTLTGKTYNESYNNNIRYFTMCHTILDLLKAPEKYPHFEYVLKKHFYLKKETILATCQKWTNDAKKTENITKCIFGNNIIKYDDYVNVFNEIKTLLNKLIL